MYIYGLIELPRNEDCSKGAAGDMANTFFQLPLRHIFLGFHICGYPPKNGWFIKWKNPSMDHN